MKNLLVLIVSLMLGVSLIGAGLLMRKYPDLADPPRMPNIKGKDALEEYRKRLAERKIQVANRGMLIGAAIIVIGLIAAFV